MTLNSSLEILIVMKMDVWLYVQLAASDSGFSCCSGALGSFSLSVRDLDQTQGDIIKHYRIRNLDAGGFYITTKISFSSLSELVKHYSRMFKCSYVPYTDWSSYS